MKLRIEFHDGDIEDRKAGSLLAKPITVASPREAEIAIKEELSDPGEFIHRVYISEHGSVLAVIAPNEGNAHYVGTSPHWRGEWEIPYLHQSARSIATAQIGVHVGKDDDLDHWARQVLKDREYATAVLVDAEGVVAAWERSGEDVEKIAVSPRPIPLKRVA